MAYEKSQALRDYINRIGAEELSFKRWMVKEYHGHYYEEKALIRIEDGKIKCSEKTYEPTKEEREAIEKALINADFPKSIGASNVDGLGPMLNPTGQTYEIWDRKTDKIVMVQQAVRLDDGTKSYPVWSFWSDGVWRKMEPDGRLPFWKTRYRTMASRLMIHEGAKVAKYVQEEIVEKGGAGHPWGGDLCLYEHWGLLGGALAPHRSLYDEIYREGFSEVVYACDNDFPGQSAVQEVSRAYRRAMKAVRPTDHFPEAWDMAEAMPKEMFSGTRWVGPTLDDLTHPATWATNHVTKPGTKKPITVITKDFKEEWCHCVVPEVFIHRDWPSKMWDSSQFDNLVSPFSDLTQTSTHLKKDATSKGAIIKYSPADPPGIFSDKDMGRYVNTFVPCQLKKEMSSTEPWEEFLEKLVPIETDRNNLKRWCATLIDRPDVKMMYGVLLISEVQGVGKGTLGEKILAPLVGINNVSFPSENEIVDSNYNYWLAHKRLSVVHEIYAGHSAKAYNRLKTVITDKYITVSRKYQANYEVENWIHVFACSNSYRAIQLSSSDRRWFVPKVTDKKSTPQYWTDFFEWLNYKGGLAAIRWWAENYVVDKSHVVMPGEDAPWSTIKASVVREGRSSTENYVGEIFEEIRRVMTGGDPFKIEAWQKAGVISFDEAGEPEIVTTDMEIIELVKEKFYDGRNNDRLLKASTVRRIAKECGFFVRSDRIRCPNEWGTQRGAYVRSILISNSPSLAQADPAQIKIKPLTKTVLGDL